MAVYYFTSVTVSLPNNTRAYLQPHPERQCHTYNHTQKMASECCPIKGSAHKMSGKGVHVYVYQWVGGCTHAYLPVGGRVYMCMFTSGWEGVHMHVYQWVGGCTFTSGWEGVHIYVYQWVGGCTHVC